MRPIQPRRILDNDKRQRRLLEYLNEEFLDFDSSILYKAESIQELSIQFKYRGRATFDPAVYLIQMCLERFKRVERLSIPILRPGAPHDTSSFIHKMEISLGREGTRGQIASGALEFSRPNEWASGEG
jgi:hypothetical protein